MTRSGGFTLIEILVVLVIAGMITTLALISVRGGGEHRLAHDELRRLERLVEVIADESVYRVLELGLEFRASGYRVLAWDGHMWAPLPTAGALRPRRWPDTLLATLAVEGAPVALTEAFREKDPVPQVVFLSSGEVSAFTLDLMAGNAHGGRLAVHLTGDAERTQIEGTLR